MPEYPRFVLEVMNEFPERIEDKFDLVGVFREKNYDIDETYDEMIDVCDIDYEWNMMFDEYVDELTIGEIKEKMEELELDVYDAIEIHKENYGGELPDFRDKKHFYAYCLVIILQENYKNEEFIKETYLPSVLEILSSEDDDASEADTDEEQE